MNSSTAAALSLEHARSEVAARLHSRRAEIEQAALNRLQSISDAEPLDPTYSEGLRAAITAALDYGLGAVTRSSELHVPIPGPLLAQARLAARSGVSLETVMRRCFAGYTLLNDYLLEELEDGKLFEDIGVKRLLRAQATLFDHLMAALAEEYAREEGNRRNSAEERRAMQIRQLLDGELVDNTKFAYDFGACHLGAVAQGDGALEAIRGLAAALDRRLLLVRPSEDLIWAWIGGRHPLAPEKLFRCISLADWAGRFPIALGEPGEGLAGWRLSHRQANAALPIALRGPRRVVRYADVALLAAVLQDELLATSLHRLYLAPLENDRDGGGVLRETLRAYFAAHRNVSSAAAALRVSRQAVAKRLHLVEELVGRPLSACSTELETALRALDNKVQPDDDF
jgi:PucR C-terminal helix-turn-helix domain/GGDEF-like domain